NVALIRDNDLIEINIPERTINLLVSEDELNERRKEESARGNKAFTPPHREREVSKALRAYASMVSSADKGAVRLI
ncbi:MAG: dihydroxy-acid dehydratase, partial [Bacteroidales bacterium]|nr:dihydroxy-acid dehydratase [Bacteroidales bacterium]